MAAGVGIGVVKSPVVWPAPDYDTVAASVRDLFRSLDLDAGNPLGRWIRPGMRVVIKPNWVKHESGDTVGCNVLYTHISLVRVLIEAALRALDGSGRVDVADAPLQGCDFQRLRQQSGLAGLEAAYEDAPVYFHDLRLQWADIDDASSYVRAVRSLPGDPLGYSTVDLGPRSRLMCFGVNERFGVTDYSAGKTNGFHHGSHSYLVSNTVLGADVILNVPKLKTHIKTGMTGALKNFVGIIGSKDCLPHFRTGSPRNGGDEYPDRNWVSRVASPARVFLQSRAPLWAWKLARAGARATHAPLISGGAWHGNDTLWRTVHDLVDIARNYTVGGVLRATPRPMLTLVDAIVAGEDCGPLRPRPKPTGMLIWGEDPGMVDVACATLMGFAWRRIPLLAHLRDAEARHFCELAEVAEFERLIGDFQAPPGWAGKIELGRKE